MRKGKLTKTYRDLFEIPGAADEFLSAVTKKVRKGNIKYKEAIASFRHLCVKHGLSIRGADNSTVGRLISLNIVKKGMLETEGGPGLAYRYGYRIPGSDLTSGRKPKPRVYGDLFTNEEKLKVLLARFAEQADEEGVISPEKSLSIFEAYVNEIGIDTASLSKQQLSQGVGRLGRIGKLERVGQYFEKKGYRLAAPRRRVEDVVPGAESLDEAIAAVQGKIEEEQQVLSLLLAKKTVKDLGETHPELATALRLVIKNDPEELGELLG
ncbi:MAG TPA: hypothetical protein VLA04_02695 [Verrucomicrobiae bacterium]|nr:hypothetical protein [Verrucomicrobiae bacterium]